MQPVSPSHHDAGTVSCASVRRDADGAQSGTVLGICRSDDVHDSERYCDVICICMRDETRALRALIETAIAESTDEFGYQFGSTRSLYDTFVKPVTDVGRVAKAELKKTAARGKALGKTAIEAAISTLIPILDADYDEIRAQAAEKIKSAEAEAGDAYDEVKRALSSSDAVMLALLYAPSATLASAAHGKLTSTLKRAFGVSEAVRASDKRLAALSVATRDATQTKLRAIASLATSISRARDAAALAKATGAKAIKTENVSELKAAALKKLADSIAAETETLVKAGAPKSSQLVKDHLKTVRFIRDLGGHK